MKKIQLIIFLIFALLVSGCSRQQATETETKETETTSTSALFSDRDFEVGYDESESIYIQLNENTAACTSSAVKISDNIITISDEGTYILSGTLNDGMIIVDTDKTKKVQLVLDNVTIHSKTSAPIYILQADKVFITMAADSTNTLSNGGTFTAIDENNIDAVIFSKEDLTLNGAGTLIITSPSGHGIVSKDALKITSGTYDINSASHALAGKDEAAFINAEFKIVSGKDGIHAENADDDTLGYINIISGTFDITAEGDGISAANDLVIEDGTFHITAGGGSINAAVKSSESYGHFMGGGRHPDGPMQENFGQNPFDTTDSTSMKGMKAAADLVINAGEFTIDTADDAIHSNASMTINGGIFEISSGDDAFHADENLTVSDGTINILESYEGLEALHLNITGGNMTLKADDDGLNAAGGKDASGMGGRDGMFGAASSNGSISISGGTINITAYGDGIDANGSLEVSGGYIVVCGPIQGDTSTLDYDTSATISGGTFIGTGAAGMAQTFSDAKQGVIAFSVSNQSAETEITLTDSDGNIILTHTPDLPFEVVILSSPKIISGQSYTLTMGTASQVFTAK